MDEPVKRLVRAREDYYCKTCFHRYIKKDYRFVNMGLLNDPLQCTIPDKCTQELNGKVCGGKVVKPSKDLYVVEKS